MIKLDGYELIVGSSIDPQFGPVLLFGWGGQLVEVFRDRALARRMMEQTRIYKTLKGVRGRAPVSKLRGTREAEFAILISDPWQGHGLDREWLTRLVQIGRDEKLRRISADILGDNIAMQRVATKARFTLKRVDGEYRAELDL